MEATQWTRKKIHSKKHPKKESETMNLTGFFDDLFEKKKEGFEPTTATTAPTSAAPTSAATTAPTSAAPLTLQQRIDDKLNATKKSGTSLKKSIESETAVLKTEISHLSSDIEQLGSIGSEFGSLEGSMNVDLNTSQNLKYLDSLNITKGLTTSISELAGLIQITVQSLVSYIILAKKTIELFILELNSNITALITKIANALTQNTATDSEIQIFQTQTQMFLFIMTVWMFVYNWYYVFFFLEKKDDIRYTFDTARMQDYSGILYGAFGTSVKLVEWVNWGLVELSTKVKHFKIPIVDQKIPNAIIYVFLFFMFAILVSSDFQSTLVIDFFKALRHEVSHSSVLYIFSAIFISIFALKYLIWESGIFSYLQNIFGRLAFLPFLVIFIFYAGWTTQVSIPLGIIFVIGYLVLNCFGGVFYYEGLNALNIFTGISDAIAPIGPDINAGDVCINYESPTWWEHFSSYPYVIWYYFKRIINYITAYMFEIIVILLLLGGIGTYSANFKSSIEGKVGLSAFNPSSVKQAFKQLFTWLIMINIIIIVLIVMFAVRKYRQIQSLTPSSTEGTGTIDMTQFNINRTENMEGGGSGIGIHPHQISSPIQSSHPSNTDIQYRAAAGGGAAGGRGF